MAGLALWNDWLYEALAEATDQNVMVLNLDAMEDYETALLAVERHFIVYNPGPTRHSFRVVFRHLPEADYLLSMGSGETKHPAGELKQGLPLTLQASEHIRITLRSPDNRQRRVQIEQQGAAQNALADAYQKLQEQAAKRGDLGGTSRLVHDFALAWRAFREGHYPEARAAAKRVVEQAGR
jgi:predicted Rdx family selenoprotein